ncbi:MAG: Wzz/FepE/Etk N-terminal domain-containing protein [Thermodesulfobacteriota bacterium]|nr:Wzz/FepE/Etk N-terminal domain-containing protein [Thermodesulfobacteriota bacterium]
MEEHEMSPNEYLGVLKRRKWSLVLPAIIVIMIATVVALALPPVYRSTSTILIEKQEIPADFVMTTVTTYAEQRLQTIHQRIMTTTRLLEIINRLDLYKNLRKKVTTEEVVEKMREQVNLEYISAEIVDRRTGRPATANIAFTLSYESTGNPVMVQKVANILASLLLEENLRIREQQAMEATSFLEVELKKVKSELDNIEQEISEFKKEHINELPELLQVNLQSRHSVEMAKERLDEQLSTLKERQSTLQVEFVNLSPSLELEDVKRLEHLKIELNRLETLFTDQYPDVINTRKEIARLTEKVAADEMGSASELPDNPAYITMSSQLSGLQSEIDSVKRQRIELQKKEDELNRWIDSTPHVEEMYNDFQAKRRNWQAKYDDLSQKLLEANVAYGLEKEQKAGRFTMIDPARLPEKPFKPNRLAIFLIGVVLGIGAGVGTVALAEFSDESVRNAEILTGKTSFPVLASIPRIITAADCRQVKARRRMAVLGVICLFIAALTAFHFFVMDLNVLWAKLMRRI